MSEIPSSCCPRAAHILRRAFAVLAAIAFAPSLAAALTIDFEQFQHGEVIGGVEGVDIRAVNYARDFDLAVVFDSRERDTRDPDLEDPWSAGNLVESLPIGNLLIIQENDDGCDAVGDVCSNPDDEGRRPAGELIFDFALPTPFIGFDVIDIDDAVMERGELTLTDSLGGSVTLGLESVLTAFGVGDVVLGDNSANRVGPIDAAGLELQDIVQATFVMGGSGALDNIEYAIVPEPATAVLMGLGLVGLAVAGRRRA
jgi:hypothetical protein